MMRGVGPDCRLISQRVSSSAAIRHRGRSLPLLTLLAVISPRTDEGEHGVSAQLDIVGGIGDGEKAGRVTHGVPPSAGGNI